MIPQRQLGILEVIVGPMYSGKSAELLRRISMLKFAKKNVLVVKHSIDKLFSQTEIISRIGTKHSCNLVGSTQELKQLFEQGNYNALVIDEVHFFEKDLAYYLQELADRGVATIVAGLDNDHLREPWEIICHLLAIAENVVKLKAICSVCFMPATFSFRKVKVAARQLVGNTEIYDSRCRQCWKEGYLATNESKTLISKESI